MVHSGNCGFLALTELFQKQLSPTRPTRIQNLNVVRDGNNGGFASNATQRRTNSLRKMIVRLLEEAEQWEQPDKRVLQRAKSGGGNAY